MTILNRLERLIGTSAFMMFAAMFLLTLAQVVFRYLLQISVPWTEEVARALFVLATLSGITLAWRQREHIIVDFLFVKFSPQVQRWLSMGFAISILLFLAFWARGAFDSMNRNWAVGLITVEWFRIAFFYLWELMMIALLAVYLLLDLKQLATGNITSLQAPDQEADL